MDTLTGRFQQSEDMAFRIAFVTAECFAVVAAMVYAIGIYYSKTAIDYRTEESQSLIRADIDDEDMESRL